MPFRVYGILSCVLIIVLLAPFAASAHISQGPEPATTTPSTANWGNPATLPDHFSRHGPDFTWRSADEYARLAQDWKNANYRDPQVQVKEDSNTLRMWNPRTNTFGSYNKYNGATRTFYMPSPAIHGHATNEDYWAEQPGADPRPALAQACAD